MMNTGNGQLSVPPGFRFHPTDEELLYYYLRKKVSYEAIDLDVIREVDLNKLEPWDLKDKCRIGSARKTNGTSLATRIKSILLELEQTGPQLLDFGKQLGGTRPSISLAIQEDWDAKDPSILHWTGPSRPEDRWIMHEYRLDDQYSNEATPSEVQEDGWVVCRVFKKKNHNRSPFQTDDHQDHTFQAEDDHQLLIDQDISKHGSGLHTLHSYDSNNIASNTTLFDGSMHLPQLLTPHDHGPYFLAQRQGAHLVNNNENNETSTLMMSNMDSSRNLLSLMSASQGACGCNSGHPSEDKPLLATSSVTADWSFLDKLLATNQHPAAAVFDHHSQQGTCHDPSSSQPFHHPDVNASSHIFPFHYLGYETDILSTLSSKIPLKGYYMETM